MSSEICIFEKIRTVLSLKPIPNFQVISVEFIIYQEYVMLYIVTH